MFRQMKCTSQKIRETSFIHECSAPLPCDSSGINFFRSVMAVVSAKNVTQYLAAVLFPKYTMMHLALNRSLGNNGNGILSVQKHRVARSNIRPITQSKTGIYRGFHPKKNVGVCFAFVMSTLMLLLSLKKAHNIRI